MNRRLVFRQPHGSLVTLTQTPILLQRVVRVRDDWPNWSERLEGPFEHPDRVWDAWEAFERRIGSEEIP